VIDCDCLYESCNCISEAAAKLLIYERHIVAIAEVHPACRRFRLGDGSLLTLWDGGYEHGSHWEHER
jgi:hypothetical protein